MYFCSIRRYSIRSKHLDGVRYSGGQLGIGALYVYYYYQLLPVRHWRVLHKRQSLYVQEMNVYDGIATHIERFKGNAGLGCKCNISFTASSL